MKKILVLLFLMVIGTCVYAQKSYVNVYVSNYMADQYGQEIYITGNRPSGINSHYSGSDNMTIGRILNLLSQQGYEVEFVTNNAVYGSYLYRSMNYLLSKKSSSNQTQIEGDLNKDGEVNISDINRLVGIILGYVREHPEVLNQVELLKP